MEGAEFEKLRNARAVDDGRVAGAYKRLMEAEQILYDRWERENASSELRGDNVGLLLSLRAKSDGRARVSQMRHTAPRRQPKPRRFGANPGGAASGSDL